VTGISLFEKFFREKDEFVSLELTLSRINRALKPLSLPRDTRVIHIAGTNGKGSTSLFLSHLLFRRGFNSLLFTSPHITGVEERIQYNLKPISRETFDRIFALSEDFLKKQNLSFFETLFLMTILFCEEVKPDFLILETGLGGRFDATNTDFIKGKTPVLTSMGQDHQLLLGSGISDIINEKIAIVKGNTPLFLGYNPGFVVDFIINSLPGCDVRPLFNDPAAVKIREETENLYHKPFSYNYLNAHRVAEYLLDTEFSPELFPLPPCRMEKFGRIILDGAHNPAAIISILRGLPSLPAAAVVSSTIERDLFKFCRVLSSKSVRIFLTVIPGNPRSCTEAQLRKIQNRDIYLNPEDALNAALKAVTGDILVCGSLYLCACLRNSIKIKYIYA
jgi:dihydrofolate synthase/folylpolyglutamate synthase